MTATTRTPIHLWIVAILSLLWNGVGATDYAMTQLHNTAYMAQMTPAQIAYFAGFPWYEVMVWALGVWGAIAGSMLLLLRSGYAVTAFAVSLAGLAASTAWQRLVSDLAALGPIPLAANIAQLVIWTIAILLLVYAVRGRQRGWLR